MKKKKASKKKINEEEQIIKELKEKFEKDDDVLKLEDYPEEKDYNGVKYYREDIMKNIEELKDELPFKEINRKKKWYNPFSWKKKEPEKQEGNDLFLMDNEMGIKYYTNVHAGVFQIEKEVNEGEKSRTDGIILKPNKLRTYEDKDGNLRRCWVADINNSVALPDEPIYSAQAVSETIRSAIDSYMDFGNVKKKPWWRDYLWIIPTVLIVLYFMYYFGWLDKIIAMFSDSPTETPVKDSIKEVTGGIVGSLVFVKLKIKEKWNKKKKKN